MLLATIPSPYATLPVDTADWLREQTEQLDFLFRRSCEDIFAIGRIISEVKNTLERGCYLIWVSTDLPFGESTAKKYRRVAEELGDTITPDIQDKFRPKALYLLASPTTTLPARKLAIELAEQGHTIDAPAARRIIKESAKQQQEERPPVAVVKRRGDDIESILRLALPVGGERRVNFDLEVRLSPDDDLIVTVSKGSRRSEATTFAAALQGLLERDRITMPKIDPEPHREWAEGIGAGIARFFGFPPGSQEWLDIRQVAVGEMLYKTRYFDEEKARDAHAKATLEKKASGPFHAGDAFQGWAHISIRKECQRVVEQLRNGGLYRTKRGEAIVVGRHEEMEDRE